MSEERRVDTGGGSAIGGNVGTGGGDVAGRDHAEATGNIVNVYTSSEKLHRKARRNEVTPNKRPEDVTLSDVYQVLAGDKFNRPGLVKTVNGIDERLENVEGRLGKVEGRLDNVDTELVELNTLIRERFERGRITLTPSVALSVIVVMLLLASAVAFLIWLNARGGTLDGQLGAALLALFFR